MLAALRPLVRRALGPRSAPPVALGLALLLWIGDALTGIEIAFTLVYLVPIGIAVWFRGRALAAFTSLVCVSFGVASEVWTRLAHGWPFHVGRMIWNHGGSLVLFLVLVEVLWVLRAYVEREERERAWAIEQLRHQGRLNVLGTLAAGVAHELGTPLGIVLGSAELVAEDPAAGPGARQLAGKIRTQSLRMRGIVQKLLDFGRNTRREEDAVDLSALVRDSVAMLAPIAKKGGASLAVSVPGDALVVRGSAIELTQVLSNLVVNAIQAMPGGGAAEVVCERRADRRGKELAALVVRDTGTGIRPEDLPHVFDPFFTTKDVGSGTGLGLSVSYGIVRDHHGHIHVESELGRGSTFTVLIPTT